MTGQAMLKKSLMMSNHENAENENTVSGEATPAYPQKGHKKRKLPLTRTLMLPASVCFLCSGPGIENPEAN